MEKHGNVHVIAAFKNLIKFITSLLCLYISFDRLIYKYYVHSWNQVVGTVAD